jgi:hypothetical protein
VVVLFDTIQNWGEAAGKKRKGASTAMISTGPWTGFPGTELGGSVNGKWAALPNRRSLPIEHEKIVHAERGKTPRPSAAVQEFDLRAVRRQQLHNGTHVAHLDLWVIAAAEHGHQVEELRSSGVGHRQILLLYSI